MYTRYFGLKENPFSIAPDPRYLYLSRRHQEALAHLIYGVTEGGGFVQLTGDVGTGKTMLIRALVERLPSDVDVALVLYPLLSVREFMGAICDELQIGYSKSDATLKELIDSLNARVLDNFAKGRRTVLIIDEAQNLSRDVLEQLRLLTNLETSKEKLLQILLVGQPELNSLLAQDDMRQLAQRITARYDLGSLFAHETSEYIVHRCLVAGAKSPLFAPSAMRWVHRLSVGVPRVINIICDRALLGAYARGKTSANAKLVRRAAGQVGQVVPKHFLLRPAILVPAALGVALIVWGWQFAPVSEQEMQSNEVAISAAPTDRDADDQAISLGTMTADAKPPSEFEAPAPQQSPVEVEPPIEKETKRPELAALLADPTIPTDTDSAFAGLFARWGLDYDSLKGNTGCARAQETGLRCIFKTGTWNNLRQFNRPAVIELLDGEGKRHHVLVASLDHDEVLADFDGQQYSFPLSEVDKYWYGQFLLLWRPPLQKPRVLRRGMRGRSVAWLSNILARYNGSPKVSRKNVFDRALEAQVKAFQRDHHLVADGVVGSLTMIQLNTYDVDNAPPMLWQVPDASSG
ncbi:MAG: AAA family ATPase [Acidiferrobacterales bacterium]